MAKKAAPEENSEQKVLTKYDRKMAARKAQEEKDKRDDKIFKIVSSLIGIFLILAVVISIGTSVVNKQSAIKGTYITVGNRNVSQLEFDYYYNASVNDYLNTYGSLLPYMGLDTTQDFAKQAYDENMSWKDMFDQSAVQQMQQIYALTDDAKANGFTYDDAADYAERTASYEQAASAAGITESEYYKNIFGKYATKNNVAPFIREGILAAAYYNHLIETNVPSAEEITAYYNENPQNYDKVDYRSFVFTAEIGEDASEEDIAKVMSEIEEKADAFVQARQNGSDFEELCIQNASDEAKADYENADTEYCLNEGQYRAYTPSAISGWLYEDGRKEGDIEAVVSEGSHQYYVVEFVNRYYDAEESDAEISDLLASDNTISYVSGLMETYEIGDAKGRLKYLTIDTTTQESESVEEPVETEESAEPAQ